MNLLITLLRFYPREWRVRYEDEFSALLEQNSMSLLDIGDIALGALDAHLRPQVAARQVSREGRPLVNTSSFLKWSGMAGMIGSVLTLLGVVLVSSFSDKEYPYTYNALDITFGSMFLAGTVLTIVLLIGLTMAYGRRVGVLGQLGLLIAVVSLLSQTYGGLGHLVEMISGVVGDWWGYFMLGLFGTILGVSLFSLGAILQKSLPLLGTRLVAVGGFSGLAVLLLSMVFFQGLESEPARAAFIAVYVACMICFSVGLFLLAYNLWNGRPTVVTRIEPAPLT